MFFGLEWCVRQMENEKMKSEIIPLFSTPVIRTNIGRDFTKPETDCFKNISMWKDEKQGMQNHISKDAYLFDSHVDTLKDIKTFCEDELKRFLEGVGGVNTDLVGLRITQSWSNKTKPSESHHLHHHGNSYLSGVLYITCLPNDHINLSNRMQGMFNNTDFPIKEITPWNIHVMKINVKEGDLIIFPSWVPHYVDVNETKDKERISFSFNTFPIGEMGDYYGSHLKL